MTSSRRMLSSGALLCALTVLLFSAGDGAASGGHQHISFHASGTWQVSPPSTCGSDECYTATGSLTVNNTLPVTFTANGMFDPNTCKTTRTRTCCINTMLGTVQTPDGNVDFTFAGKGCQLSATLETLKGPMKFTGESGLFAGGSGAGHLSARVDPENGQGPITITGAVHN